jgi:hypothetical protein
MQPVTANPHAIASRSHRLDRFFFWITVVVIDIGIDGNEEVI